MFLEGRVEGRAGIEADLQTDFENAEIGVNQQPSGFRGAMAVHEVKEVHAHCLNQYISNVQSS